MESIIALRTSINLDFFNKNFLFIKVGVPLCKNIIDPSIQNKHFSI